MSSEVFTQESTIDIFKIRNAVENITPQIKIIPLMNDPIIVSEGEFGTAMDGRTWILVEHHDHPPLEEYLARIHRNRQDIHVQLLASFG